MVFQFKTPSLPRLTLFEFAARNNPESVPMRVLCPCLCLLHLPGSREKGVPSLRCASHATRLPSLSGQHALFKSRQRKDLGQNSGFSLATITYQAGAAAGVQIWMIGVAVSIPVIFTVVGLVVGFFMGITIGALLAGILIYSQVTVTPDMETAIGVLISLVLIFFSAAPPSFTVNFL